MKNKKIVFVGTMLLIIIVVVSFFYVSSNNSPVDTPEGYVQFSNSKIPYTFFYPEDMTIAINYNNQKSPIITVTSPDDPSYYFAITGNDVESMDTHFSQVNTDLINELLLLTDGMLMQTTDFFDINTNVIEINGKEADFVEIISKDMELTPYQVALFNIKASNKDDFAFVVFVSGTNDERVDTLTNSLNLK